MRREKTSEEAIKSSLGQLAQQLQDLRLILASNSPAIIPIHRLPPFVSKAHPSSAPHNHKDTYHRPLKSIRVPAKHLLRLVLVARAGHNRAHARLPDVLQDGLQLVRRRQALRHVQLKVRGRGAVVVAGLVLGGRLRGVGRGLLEEGDYARGGGRAGLVEEGDDVPGFALWGGGEESVSSRDLMQGLEGLVWSDSQSRT